MKKLFFYISLGMMALPVKLFAATDFGLGTAATAAGLPKSSTSITDIVANVVNIALSMIVTSRELQSV